MIRRPPRSTRVRSSAASDVYKRQGLSILQHKSEFQLDLPQIAEIWRHGSVVRSWLLDLTADALGKNPRLHGVAPYVADSGEGRWTAAEAIELGVPAPVITASLFERFR